MIKRYLIITAILITTNIFSFSQSITNSPYTRFGIGEIDRNGFNHSKAMGGLSTGLRTRNQINYMNPAAISSQDTMSFIFDIGISGISKELSSETDYSEYNDFGFNHLAISFPIKKWWFASAGITPYSKIGYDIMQVSEFEPIDTIDEYKKYFGRGGINQFFISNSFKLFTNFSLGFNLNYLFGTIEQYDQAYLETPVSYCTVVEDKITLSKLNYEIGFQYFNDFQQNYFIVIGLTYSNKTIFNSTKQTSVFMTGNFNLYDINVIDYLNNYQNVNVYDTISSVTDNNYKLEIPAKYSVGFTFGKKNKLVIGMDYSYQDWSNITSLNNNDNFDTDQLFNFGFEYTPNIFALRNYLKKISYRTGFYYNNSYLRLESKQINNYGITFGLGFPIGNQRTNINMSYTLGKRGTTSNGLIEENYSSFGINLTLYDFWFIKRKFQ
ncbi:MAG: hypothetical protein KOO66_00815 [Bacteroidales bacterium]|nr:hypothetical protein [Bacteroidales bacterium]